MRTPAEVADLAGTTVRTLHHYDRIGLLRPSQRTPAGHRLYGHDDLVRLQQIMAWRELGFALADIPGLLDGRGTVQALRAQRRALAGRIESLSTVLQRLEETLATIEDGTTMEEEHMFDGFDPAQHAEEAEERWGDTEQWRQSQQRVAAMSPQQMADVMAEVVAHAARMAGAMQAGVAPTSTQGMDLAEEARLHIDRHFYDCPPQMHVGLGEMYVTDPRFTAFYDTHADGLAVWFREAIVANAAR